MDYLLEIEKYRQFLIEEEKSLHTIEKYIRDVRKFLEFMKEKIFDKQVILDFKTYLIENYAPQSVNSMIASVNSFLSYINLQNLRVKSLKIQREIFLNPEKEITKNDYQKLVNAAEKQGNRSLSLLIQTICSTGIRVSELRYITIEAIKNGRVLVSCKNKKRVVFFPKNLIKGIKKYCTECNIKTGIIFKTKNGNPLDRSNIWRAMKNLCKQAKVLYSKVFPHNLRHLFAQTYYKINKDISKLADLLGHSNINTTRIYTKESGISHIKQLEKMNLLLNTSTQHNKHYVVEF